MWWSCPKLKEFWRKICAEVVFMFNLPLKLTPGQCLLRLNMRLTKSDAILANNLLIAAKPLIAKLWKSEEEPILIDWHLKCQHLALMNKLTAIKSALNGSEFALFTFFNTWVKFVNYWKLVNPKENVREQILEMLQGQLMK